MYHCMYYLLARLVLVAEILHHGTVLQYLSTTVYTIYRVPVVPVGTKLYYYYY